MTDAPTGSAPTLRDVATEAGVSAATASRALNGSTRNVSAEKLALVLQAAAKLGYAPNLSAQATARGSTKTVALIVHDIADPYFAAIAAGAMREAREHDLMVMVACTFREPSLELEYIARLRAQRARAIVLAASSFTGTPFASDLAETLSGYAEQGGRVVAIGDHGPTVDAVIPSNHDGGALAASHLLSLGHKRIGVVSGPAALRTVADRYAGFTSLVPSPVMEAADFSRDGGYQAGRRLLKAHPELTAIFALDDLMAFGVLAAARDLGIAVPSRLSVIGFDDVPGAADVGPPLSTVRLDLATLGARVLQLAVAAGSSTRVTEPFPVSLVTRSSTGPAAA
jgi:LacI family transcriptional regulator